MMDCRCGRTRVSLGFTHPPRANGTDDLMPRSVVSMLRCGVPTNWGTLRVLASSEIAMPNPNRMWSLKNEIGYFRYRHHRPIEFDVSLIALTSSKLWPSKDWPRNTLRAPWRLLSTGWPRMMDALRANLSIQKVHSSTIWFRTTRGKSKKCTGNKKLVIDLRASTMCFFNLSPPSKAQSLYRLFITDSTNLWTVLAVRS